MRKISPDGYIEVDLEGAPLLTEPLLNKGMAFDEQERNLFGLHGLLPAHVSTLDEQMERRLEALRQFETGLEKYLFLRNLQDTNETLFYALLERNLAETLPAIYTPSVGEGCQEFSHYWRYPRGLFLSWPQRDQIEEILNRPRYDYVETIVVSDGERILGLGDQGAGGMGIPIGKLSLYTAIAGLDPGTALPILLDVGTDNPERLADPLYVGWRHKRIRGAEYEEFVERFVSAVEKRWPNVLLQWEDFARAQAGKLLHRYRDRLLTFNDDIQGTAAVAAGTLLAAVGAAGQKIADQRIAIVGAGSAGCGIGNLILREMMEAGLSEAEAKRRFFAIDAQGLLVEDMPGLLEFQAPFVQSAEAVSGWSCETPGRIGLLDVVKNAEPTVLIGVSGQPGLFTEEAIRAMAAKVERPVIMPLSNPTSHAEATPQELIQWTEGRAVIGTGSPFPPVYWNGAEVPIAQTNNAYVFPGLGLGVLAVQARRVSDGMFAAAARALANMSPAWQDPGAPLLPPVDDLRAVAMQVAKAVALRAREEGLCPPFEDDALEEMIRAQIWEPVYRPYRPKVPKSET
ncbi:NAD-dependent malic enzyme [Methyloligella sp. 2.7D]|uniref:NAD-dependent malic enzyme n=1 Tax=unclassified Methyloligella TaxID=2625955 RepID=UPI00157BF498|nr:NAD-dependent malic enzyme [Methyloligella sp. GL2]QKP78280.1 NAD-dependent malic enzyme [Methyloligella sp. GL2]